MKRSSAPGSALLHPFTLAALGTLALNDHVLKQACPGVLTGKLSDFAGVLLLPLFLHALVELLAARIGQRPLGISAGDRWLVGCIVVSLLAFGLPEVWRPAELAYRYGLGAARWPFKALAAVLSGDALPGVRPVRATADVSDLLALPMGWVAFWVGRQSAAGARNRGPLAASAGIFVACLLTPHAAAASQPHSHDGFYLSMEAGPGVAWVNSTGSISNGFQQRIASTASAPVAPATALTLGGTLAQLGLVLGGRLAVANGVSPVIETLDKRFQLPDQHLLLIEISGIAQYYPDLHRGLHFGTSLGYGLLVVSQSHQGGAPGFTGSLEVGHGWFFARQWSAGLTVRLTAARTTTHSDLDIASTLLMPALLAAVTFH